MKTLLKAASIWNRKAVPVEDLRNVSFSPRVVDGAIVDPIRPDPTLSQLTIVRGPLPGTRGIAFTDNSVLRYTQEAKVLDTDFTVEMSVRFNVATGNQYIFDINMNELTLRLNGGKIELAHSVSLNSGFTPVAGVWYHIAVVRQGNIYTMYIDGVKTGPTTVSDTIFNVTSFSVGSYGGNGYNINGSMYGVKFTTRAVYTGNFTPPGRLYGESTEEPTVAPEPSTVVFAPRMVSGIVQDPTRPILEVKNISSSQGPAAGTRAMTITGSGYVRWQGSSETITGDYTVETYVKFDSLSAGNQYIFDTNSNGLTLRYYSGTLQVAHAISLNSGIAPVVGRWYHIALVRKGSTATFYVDGVARDSRTNSSNLTYTRLTAGNHGGSSYFLNGSIYGLRVHKRAVYDGNFVPELL